MPTGPAAASLAYGLMFAMQGVVGLLIGGATRLRPANEPTAQLRMPTLLVSASQETKLYNPLQRTTAGRLSTTAVSTLPRMSRWKTSCMQMHRCPRLAMCQSPDIEDEYLAARAARLASYCEDEVFNDGCSLEDDNQFGDRDVLVRGQALEYVGWVALAVLAYSLLSG